MTFRTHIGMLAHSLAELEKSIIWLDEYVASFMACPCPALELKATHTANVTLIAQNIATDLKLGAEDRRSALLGALFHDVGRFPQFYKWKTFRDADSVNHGLLGARTLARQGPLAEESVQVRKNVIAAVALHNRYALPPTLAEGVRVITNLVRDADKIDILRIFSEEFAKAEPSPDVLLHVAREPDMWTPHIAQKILRGETPDYSELRYANDFIMLLCSWPASLNYASSLRLLIEKGYLVAIMSCLPANPQMDAIRGYVLQQIGKTNA